MHKEELAGTFCPHAVRDLSFFSWRTYGPDDLSVMIRGIDGFLEGELEFQDWAGRSCAPPARLVVASCVIANKEYSPATG